MIIACYSVYSAPHLQPRDSGVPFKPQWFCGSTSGASFFCIHLSSWSSKLPHLECSSVSTGLAIRQCHSFLSIFHTVMVFSLAVDSDLYISTYICWSLHHNLQEVFLLPCNLESFMVTSVWKDVPIHQLLRDLALMRVEGQAPWHRLQLPTGDSNTQSQSIRCTFHHCL